MFFGVLIDSIDLLIYKYSFIYIIDNTLSLSAMEVVVNGRNNGNGLCEF